MVTIEIDGNSYKVSPGRMLIEVTDELGITVPRFCYHKKLSISANCRMCLVEVEKAPKPLPACATPINDGMKVWTKSPKALAAQRSVMEFLLINHPLDCPVCDQGGECELQDLSVGYGGGKSRYLERKRSVNNNNIGPLISTEMTRCIHCMRCVRFGIEIAGVQELGATGRGDQTLVGTYLSKSIDSELSGNMIDLCPVGALTAKPSQFKARAWEMKKVPGVSPHDAIGSNIEFHVRKNEIFRVVPRENGEINETWLSDRDRFSYLSLKATDRLTTPMLKKEGEWQAVDWETALVKTSEYLKSVNGDELGFLASPSSTTEEFFLLKKIATGLQCNNIDHRIFQTDFKLEPNEITASRFGLSLNEIEQCDQILIIGSYLRKEIPLLNHRIRNAVLKNKCKVYLLNIEDYSWNFSVSQKWICSPENLVIELLSITKSILNYNSLDESGDFQSISENIVVDESKQRFAELFSSGKKRYILMGNFVLTSPEFSTIRAISRILANACNATIGFTGFGGNSVGAHACEILPTASKGRNILEMLNNNTKGYFLLNVEPDKEFQYTEIAMEAFKKADFNISLTGFFSEKSKKICDIVLPIAQLGENEGSFVNGLGMNQSFNAAIQPPGQTKPAWRVLRVLSNLLNLPEIEFNSISDIQTLLTPRLKDFSVKLVDRDTWQGKISAFNKKNGVKIRVPSPYDVDCLTRRSQALQKTEDANMNLSFTLK